jgi:hypothetical protein
MKYSISFTEESVMNPKYHDYIGGRMEVYVENEPFNVEEVRFFTKDIKGFNKFREKWECKDVSQEELDKLKDIITNSFSL